MKPTEDELRELLVLMDKVKIMSKRIEEIKDFCKERGSFATKNFVCAVLAQQRVGIAPLKEVIDCFGRETLEKYALIKLSEFQIVKVSSISEGVSQNEKKEA